MTDERMGFDSKAEEQWAEMLADLEADKAGRQHDRDYPAPDYSEVIELRSVAPVTDFASDRAEEFRRDERDAMWERDHYDRLEAA